MRRHLLALAVVGLFGALWSADASACCHKRSCAPAPCAPAPCVAVAPCPAPAPCAPAPCAPRAAKCGGFKLFRGGLCHKRQACAPVVYTAAPCAPCGAPAVYSTGQATPQS